MSEENNGNGNNDRLNNLETSMAEMAQMQAQAFARLETFEDRQNYLNEKLVELVHAQMRSESRNETFQMRNQEFQTAMKQGNEALKTEMEISRRESEKRFIRIEGHLDHLTQLVRAFGDKSFEV